MKPVRSTPQDISDALRSGELFADGDAVQLGGGAASSGWFSSVKMSAGAGLVKSNDITTEFWRFTVTWLRCSRRECCREGGGGA